MITGGSHNEKTVSRYNIAGWMEDLTNLNIGRRFHGCSSYYKDGAQASLCNSVIVFCIFILSRFCLWPVERM